MIWWGGWYSDRVKGEWVSRLPLIIRISALLRRSYGGLCNVFRSTVDGVVVVRGVAGLVVVVGIACKVVR